MILCNKMPWIRVNAMEQKTLEFMRMKRIQQEFWRQGTSLKERFLYINKQGFQGLSDNLPGVLQFCGRVNSQVMLEMKPLDCLCFANSLQIQKVCLTKEAAQFFKHKKVKIIV